MEEKGKKKRKRKNRNVRYTNGCHTQIESDGDKEE